MEKVESIHVLSEFEFDHKELDIDNEPGETTAIINEMTELKSNHKDISMELDEAEFIIGSR